jgi:hypothetical protein
VGRECSEQADRLLVVPSTSPDGKRTKRFIRDAIEVGPIASFTGFFGPIFEEHAVLCSVDIGFDLLNFIVADEGFVSLNGTILDLGLTCVAATPRKNLGCILAVGTLVGFSIVAIRQNRAQRFFILGQKDALIKRLEA